MRRPPFVVIPPWRTIGLRLLRVGFGHFADSCTFPTASLTDEWKKQRRYLVAEP